MSTDCPTVGETTIPEGFKSRGGIRCVADQLRSSNLLLCSHTLESYGPLPAYRLRRYAGTCDQTVISQMREMGGRQPLSVCMEEAAGSGDADRGG